MPRAYDVRTAALALGVSWKWVDNLLSHHSLPGVSQGRRGVTRRIDEDGVLAIELVRLLAELGVGIARAAEIARFAVSSRESGEVRYVTEGLVLVFPATSIERRLRERLLDAVDAAARVPRGRPRRKDKNKTPSD